MTLLRQRPTDELAERNRFIYEYYRAYPDATYESIGETFNISRQRVYYLIQRQFRNEALEDRDVWLESLQGESGNQAGDE